MPPKPKTKRRRIFKWFLQDVDGRILDYAFSYKREARDHLDTYTWDDVKIVKRELVKP